MERAVRRLVALLICFVFCLGAFAPLTAVYVCSRMGGQRMSKMCCVEEVPPCSKDSSLRSHCCDLDVHHALSQAASSQGTVKRATLSPPTEVAFLEAAQPPQVLSQIHTLRRQFRPPSSGGPTFLRTIVLRI